MNFFKDIITYLVVDGSDFFSKSWSLVAVLLRRTGWWGGFSLLNGNCYSCRILSDVDNQIRSALHVYSFEDTLMIRIRIINVSSKEQTSRKDQTTNADQSKWKYIEYFCSFFFCHCCLCKKKANNQITTDLKMIQNRLKSYAFNRLFIDYESILIKNNRKYQIFIDYFA